MKMVIVYWRGNGWSISWAKEISVTFALSGTLPKRMRLLSPVSLE